MNTQEVAKLLTIIASVDDRFDPDEARLLAWENILDPDMTYSFAVESVKKHYANDTKTMMPAELNLPWRNFRELQIRLSQIGQAEEHKREISPETKRLLEELKVKLQTRNKVRENAENRESAE